MRAIPGPRKLLVAALTAAVAAVGAAPGQALAEGPGYGGTADQLNVDWGRTTSTDELVVTAVGFLAESDVLVQIGDGLEQTTLADETGTLELTLLAMEDGASLADGTSITASGQTPSGAIHTVIGFVPTRPAARTWSRDLWRGALTMLVLLGVLAAVVPRSRPRRRILLHAPIGYHGRHGSKR